MSKEQLKLSNQLCFPIYAASRLITRSYQPYLDTLGITYPQYLVLLVLWETDEQTVNDITKKLILNTNTITPLLQRMEKLELISRQRSENDERKVIVRLTKKGIDMQNQAENIPIQLGTQLSSGKLQVNELIDMKNQLYKIIEELTNRE